MRWKFSGEAQPAVAQQGHGRTPADRIHKETQTKDDSRSCSVQVAEVAGKNRHAGRIRFSAQHRNADREEAALEAEGSCQREEEGSR